MSRKYTKHLANVKCFEQKKVVPAKLSRDVHARLRTPDLARTYTHCPIHIRIRRLPNLRRLLLIRRWHARRTHCHRNRLLRVPPPRTPTARSREEALRLLTPRVPSWFSWGLEGRVEGAYFLAAAGWRGYEGVRVCCSLAVVVGLVETGNCGHYRHCTARRGSVLTKHYAIRHAGLVDRL